MGRLVGGATGGDQKKRYQKVDSHSSHVYLISIVKFLIREKSWILFWILPSLSLAHDSLDQKVAKIFRQNRLDLAKISAKVVRASDREVLYEKNAQIVLNPASTTKLITMGAALKAWGPDYRFPIEFYARESVSEGVIQDLWIKGSGDPFFVTEELERMLTEIRPIGLREIRRIWVDDRFFDPDFHVTYISDDEEKTYQVRLGALSFNFNSVEIIVTPGRQVGLPAQLSLKHPTAFVTLLNKTQTIAGGRSALVSSLLADGRTIEVRGWVGVRSRGRTLRQGVSEPALFSGTIIREGLERCGIRIASPEVMKGEVPTDAKRIYTYYSPPLKVLLEALGKHSNNFAAEQLFQALGREEAVGRYLFSLGIPPETYFIENGSGLSKNTSLSAEQLTRVLSDLFDSPWREEAIKSLSVGGIDGTLKGKFRGNLRGKVFAKTGSLNGVSSLAGFVVQGEEVLIFTFLFNDYGNSPRRVAEAERQILEAFLKEVRQRSP